MFWEGLKVKCLWCNEDMEKQPSEEEGQVRIKFFCKKENEECGLSHVEVRLDD